MMLNSLGLAVCLFVTVVCRSVACGTASVVVRSHYEETFSYSRNPQCKPSHLDKGIQCSAVGSTIEPKGGFYYDFGLGYMPLASAYYVARLADALGYQDRCPTNKTFLKELDIVSPWSGTHGGIAIDGACGFERQVARHCTFPNDKYPFLCTGVEGPPGTYGKRLETLSYISILQGSNLRWTLFAHCWRAKSPKDPKSVEIATSFNVFSLDPVLSPRDRVLVFNELRKRRFNTDPSNVIEFDLSTTNCN